ncbi:MAG: DedA family protein [Francisella endosymbiont of Hyalomma asiaticum]
MSENEFSTLLIDWGYLAIMLGVLIEGEIFLIMVGIATAAALFSYTLTVIAATFAAILHDNGLFIFSKFMGRKVFEKKASWHYKAQKSLKILDKYESLVILSIRFLYGLRTITLIVVGLSKVSKIKFICLDSLSSLIWSTIYISLGYLFGNTILKFVDNSNIKVWISHNKHLSIFILILLSSIIYLSHRILRSQSKRSIR